MTAVRLAPLFLVASLLLGGCAIEDPNRRYDPYEGLVDHDKEALRGIRQRLTARDYRGAEQASRDLLSKRPELSMAHVFLGLALMGQGKLDEATQAFGDALQRDPTNAIARYDLGLIYARRGMHQAAAVQFEEAVRLDPGYTQAWIDLAVASSSSGHQDRATKAITRALRLSPNDHRAHNVYGTILLQRGMAAKAVGEFKKALGGKPDAAEYHLNLARAYQAMGREAEAAEQYRIFLQTAPADDPDRKKVREILGKL